MVVIEMEPGEPGTRFEFVNPRSLAVSVPKRVTTAENGHEGKPASPACCWFPMMIIQRSVWSMLYPTFDSRNGLSNLPLRSGLSTDGVKSAILYCLLSR